MSSISIQQYADLCQKIFDDYSVVSGKKSPQVKYIDSTVDMRNGQVFSITLRGFGHEHHFHTVNEQRDNPIPLDKRILDFLETRHNTFLNKSKG